MPARPLACRFSCRADLKSITGTPPLAGFIRSSSGRHHCLHDEPARRFQTAVQIQRCQHGLEGVHQQGRLAATSAFFFAAAEPQIRSQVQSLRHLDQVPFTHQVRAQFRKLAFPEM